MSDDLIAFLEDRLDEDKQMWGDMLGGGAELTLVGHYFREGVPGLLKRQLAEVEAKRRILAVHWPDTTRYVKPQCHECSGCGCCSVDHPCDTVKLLALPYAHHPDYREEWRPAAD